MRPAMAPMAASGDILVVLMAPDDVLAFRRTDGAMLWRTSMGGTAGAYTMAVDASAVYLTAPGGRVAALDVADGHKLWERALPGMLAQVAIARERVLVGSTDNFLYALDAESGKLQWRFRSGADVIGAAATDAAIYYASLDNILRALHRGNGNQRWMTSTPARPILPPRVVRNEVVVIGQMPTLATFDTRTGMPVNTYAAPGDIELAGAPLIDPVLRPFEVAVVIVTRDGRVLALRPESMAFAEVPPVPLAALPGRPLLREATPGTDPGGPPRSDPPPSAALPLRDR
jgi:outer membrane protein assembly factor BamB